MMTMSVLKQPFTRANLPNTFVNLLAPVASYALIPLVAAQKLKQTHATEDEKKVLLAREVAGQWINGLIQVSNFALGMFFGNKVGKGALTRRFLGGFSNEGATLIVTGMLNFFFYTFVRPWAGLTVLDEWIQRRVEGPKHQEREVIQSTPHQVLSEEFQAALMATAGPFAAFSTQQKRQPITPSFSQQAPSQQFSQSAFPSAPVSVNRTEQYW